MKEVDCIKDIKKINKMIKSLKIQNLRNSLLFILGINTGLRISDILTIKFKDVLDNDYNIKESFFIIEQKSRPKKGRTVFINDMLKYSILEYYEYLINNNLFNFEDYIFKSRKGKNKSISRIQAWQILNDSAELVGIKGNIGTHTLRKTFGYWAYKKNNVDIFTLMKILNHSNISTTLRYIGIDKEEIRTIFKKLTYKNVKYDKKLFLYKDLNKKQNNKNKDS